MKIGLCPLRVTGLRGQSSTVPRYTIESVRCWTLTRLISGTGNCYSGVRDRVTNGYKGHLSMDRPTKPPMSTEVKACMITTPRNRQVLRLLHLDHARIYQRPLSLSISPKSQESSCHIGRPFVDFQRGQKNSSKMKDILQDMSVDDKITIIVVDRHCWTLGGDKCFGYLPNTFELRYSQDQLSQAAMSMSRYSSADKKLYESWSWSWWKLRGKARINQKLRVMGKMSEIEAAIRRTEAREIAAGRTTDARLQYSRDEREEFYQNWREGLPRYTSRGTSPSIKADDKDEDSETETKVQKKNWMARLKERFGSAGSKIVPTKTANGTAADSSDVIDGATLCDKIGNGSKQTDSNDGSTG